MDVILSGGRGDISVYVGVPGGVGPWPAALVVSDALGMTDNLRNQVDWLASIGYLAAAPDLVGRHKRTLCLFSTMRQALRGEGAVSDDFETVRRWLAGHPCTTGRVAVAGFCFDGGFALLLAGEGAFDVAGSGYGGLAGDALMSLARSCPVVAKRTRGTELKKQPAQIAEALWVHSVPYHLEVYRDSGYTFVNDHVDADAPEWALILGDMSTSESPTASAQDTRNRIRSFFDSHMARSPSR